MHKDTKLLQNVLSLRITLSAKNYQEKGLNRQGNDPWPQTVKQIHSRIEAKG